MISDLIRRYVAGPIASVLTPLFARVRLEPVVVFGIGAELLLALNAELDKGVTLEVALTAVIIAFGTRLVRQNVWPSVKVDEATGAALEPLEKPLTGLEDIDYQ